MDEAKINVTLCACRLHKLPFSWAPLVLLGGDAALQLQPRPHCQKVKHNTQFLFALLFLFFFFFLLIFTAITTTHR